MTLDNPGLPTDAIEPSKIDSENGQFLNFAPSDFDKDVAQSVIPFIDIQPIETKPAVPIVGVGIYHKGSKGYGGFLGLKISTYFERDFNFIQWGYKLLKLDINYEVLQTDSFGKICFLN